MYKLTVFIPLKSLESVKAALFEAGAGRYRQYDQCCFEIHGRGQFRPLDGANPNIGEVGKIESVDEVRVEMIVKDDVIKAVVSALRKSHPYEEPAFDIIKLVDPESLT